jgi:hypothetical protein
LARYGAFGPAADAPPTALLILAEKFKNTAGWISAKVTIKGRMISLKIKIVMVYNKILSVKCCSLIGNYVG